tara:strand:+ start:11886 stop:12485 length:600 start_codon:yes stop_codon:yes gene_type:complete
MKRVFDFLISLIGVTFLLPVFLVVSILIILNLGRPVFFKQQRPGLKGKPFTMIKFRTMNNSHDKFGNLLPDSERLTKLGNFLRSTSIDELPSLFCVLKGDMSLVGPRPLLMKYLDLYTPEQAKRHNCLPGITGWAQVKGRNEISWEKKFELDLWYVNNQSFYLDLKILFLTTFKVLKREGIKNKNSETMYEFKGKDNNL